MTTVAQLCETNGLNAKVVRAKLRRAVEAGDLKIAHDHRSQWVASDAVLTFLGLKVKAAKKTSAKKTAKKAA